MAVLLPRGLDAIKLRPTAEIASAWCPQLVPLIQIGPTFPVTYCVSMMRAEEVEEEGS